MKWNEFVENVQQWARERGIYEHSTPEAQILKALSELGELADAVIKCDKDGMKDAIGDVAVCMVNYAKMVDADIGEGFVIDNAKDLYASTDADHEVIGTASIFIGNLLGLGHLKRKAINHIYLVLGLLATIAHLHQWDFMECCEQAWNEIKNRKGTVSKGGAFVKE